MFPILRKMESEVMKMKILRIVLETANLKKTKAFYKDILEMKVVREKDSFFTVQAGKSQITFQQSEEVPFYHFAFRTNGAYLDYLFKKVEESGAELLSDENGHTSMYWEGKQIYFKDPDGNIVEILERDNPYSEEMDGFYDICEIGLPSYDVDELSNFLGAVPNQNIAESDLFRFHGDKLGNFVLVKEGRNWYPTPIPATIHPVTVEVEGSQYEVFRHSSLPYTIKVKEKMSYGLPAVQFRIARPTDKLTEVIHFYEKGLGLTRIGEFWGHDGYDGVMYGIPNVNYHLEFTSHAEGTPCPAPTKDNLLVFYIPDQEAIERITDRLATMGYHEVEPENSYWGESGVTIEDPDGWRIVLFLSTGS